MKRVKKLFYILETLFWVFSLEYKDSEQRLYVPSILNINQVVRYQSVEVNKIQGQFMKYKTHRFNSLFYSGRLIITILLLCIVSAIAQQPSPAEEFTIGASFSRYTRHIPGYYNNFRESGMNFLHQYADSISKTLLNGLNFAAYNSEWPNEWIYYYSTAYYSKWEADRKSVV